MAKIRDLIIKPSKRKPCQVTALDGETILSFDLRLLRGDETVTIERDARAFAVANGVTEAKQEDVLYLRGRMVGTLLAACSDNESPAEKPEAYFADAAEIRRFLDDARIAYIYQEQVAFQTEHAPSPGVLPYDDFIKLVWASREENEKGGDPERPFVGLPYRKVTSFAAIAASALMTPMLPQLLFGSPTPTPSPEDTGSSSTSLPTSEPADGSTDTAKPAEEKGSEVMP